MDRKRSDRKTTAVSKPANAMSRTVLPSRTLRRNRPAERNCSVSRWAAIIARVARVYLETSFFSACVTARTDVNSAFWRYTSLAWLRTQRDRHELFISDVVLGELARPSYRQSREALEFTVGMSVLDVNDDVLGIGRVLVQEKVMPGPLEGDALHVAACVHHGMDYLLTWNVAHLANPNKRTHLAKICYRLGKIPPEIVTPNMLWWSEEDA